MFKHLLIPTDGSTLSRKAVKAGIAFAKAIGAKVTVYHALEVAQPYIVADGAIGITSLKALEQEACEQAKKRLAEVAKIAEAAGIKCELYIDKPATPYQGIVEAAKRKRCDAIFIASHGRGELISLVLGSVTQKVLAHSKLPVMVYR